MMIRLQKFIADSGLVSRRKAEVLIADGKVTVNGDVVTQLGTKIDPALDEVVCNGKKIQKLSKPVYVALNKPVGYVSSAASKEGKPVTALVKVPERLYPVGRLDKASSGLIILTNDGEFANHVMHPSNGCTKEYFAVLDGDLKPEHIKKLERGMVISGQKLAPIRVLSSANRSVRLELSQGVNREIRRVLGKLGFTVKRLKRVRVGKLELGALKEGQWRKIKPEEVI